MLKIRWGWVQLPFLRIDKFMFSDGNEYIFTWGRNTYLTVLERFYD